MAKWTRPTSVPIPTIWATFQGKTVANGIRKTYWIQDITDEYIDQICEYMTEEFTKDEPLCKYNGRPLTETMGPNSNEKKKNTEQGFKKLLKDNLGLVCLTKGENDETIITGMNCTTLCSKDEDSILPEKRNKILDTLIWAKQQVDPFQKFNITEYLDAMGLYVPHKYRGEGIGLELLKARRYLCKACGLKASLTLFTSAISQKLAYRAGFKDLYVIDYDELERRNTKFSYPGIQKESKSLNFMYILYE